VNADVDEVTTSDAPALWLNVPLLAVTVSDEVPAGVPLPVFTVMVVDPLLATVMGLKLAVAPAGRPETPKLTVPLNPFTAVVVMV
jgi:hypothetical protein